ncbi:MAG: glycoside hydrolase 5 family protein [Roseiflexus sp.]
MTTLNDTFSLGVTFWPRQAGPLFWQRYDRGAVRDELAHIAALGFDTVRLCLVWEDFQPGPARINSRAMRSLEHALDVAHTTGLRVVPALFPVAVLGQLQIPVWANGPDIIGALQRAHRRQSLLIIRPPGLVPVLTGGWYRPVRCGDMFSEPMIIEAQRYLIREIAGYFGDHPAVWAWQAGEGFERVHRPESDQAAARWFETIAHELRQVAPRAVCMGVVSSVGLKRRSGPRLEDVAKYCALTGVVVDPPETPIENQMRHTNPAAYLHALAAGLAEQRMIVIGVGMPATTGGEAPGWFEDDLFGQTRVLYRGTVAEQAEFINTALERLYSDGAAGVWLPVFADFPEEQWQTPPLDRTRRYRTMGVIDDRGREKPAAAAVRDIARRLRDTATKRRQPPAVDAERYWSNPEHAFREWWQEFNSRE